MLKLLGTYVGNFYLIWSFEYLSCGNFFQIIGENNIKSPKKIIDHRKFSIGCFGLDFRRMGIATIVIF